MMIGGLTEFKDEKENLATAGRRLVRRKTSPLGVTELKQDKGKGK